MRYITGNHTINRFQKHLHKIFKQRILALFFVAVFSISICLPTAVAATAMNQNEPKHPPVDGHSKPPEGEASSTKSDSFKFPDGMKPIVATSKAATDAQPPASSKLAQTNKKIPKGEALHGIAEKPKIVPHEITEERNATTSVSVNEDGSLTRKQFLTPQFYKKEGKWADIKTTLVEDKNAGDSGNVLGRAFGEVQSWVSSSTNFTAKENDWQARFSPSGSEAGMVRIRKGESQIAFVPQGAKKIAPVITTNGDGKQVVHYYDLWPGVNVEYIVESAAVKENIVIKDKNATNRVSFKLLGANLEKQKGDDQTARYYKIKGALNDEFAVAPANLILNNFGFVSDQGVFEQSYENGVITVSVSKSYLQGLPDNAFPAVVDPTTFVSTFGSRAGGNYVSFKSDGYICYSHECNLYAGTLYDVNNILRAWRGALFSPYDQFRNSGTQLISASLHLTQRSNESFWTGDWGTHNFQVGHATCLNSYTNCVEGNQWNAAGNVTGAGDVDVTNIYQTMISRGDFGAWLMIGGEDNTTHSFKNFDPNNSYVVFTYGGIPPPPSVSSPTSDQAYVDPQPSLRVNEVANPNGSQPLKYEMLVSTATGASGGIISSNVLDATQWTVPDGILQDGTTYYAQARSYDPITGLFSGWSTSVPFRIDMRIGKDKTQTLDNLGPVGVNLATGNLMTSAASHTSAALGGNLGVGLEYKSPLKSRNGLVGEYWNVSQGYGAGTPTSGPTVTRVDRNIDFGWDNGSPAAGINNDWFYTRWTGYFVAPATGTYYFGSRMDDVLSIYINNSYINNQPGTPCYTVVCYGTGVSLQEGQVVPFRAEYQEATSPAYAHVWVKGAVDEQILPTEWLQTGVRALMGQQGLTGSYFGKFDGTNSFSSGNALIMKRNDPYLNFDWGDGAPMPSGPDGFLVRWSGYITAPETGTYTFGTRSDDGVKIMLGTNNAVVYSEWVDRGATETYGSGYALTANQPVPITIEYYDGGGPASFQLKMKLADNSTQLVPNTWLSPKAQVLPDGWTLGIDADGSLSYDHLRANQNSVVLTDSSGDTHEYKYADGGYKPPVNEDGRLVRNADGTFTLQDADGQTYVFDTDGTVKSVTSPTDDRRPAALQYAYSSVNGGPAALTQITDSVDADRWAKVYYNGDATNCGPTPPGFESTTTANVGKLCAVKTNDGRVTNFYYISGQLARIVTPGNQMTDYQYEEVKNANNVTIGYRLLSIRDGMAMDAIGAGVRADTDETNTKIQYDNVGRVISVKQPAPTAGATRVEHTIEYLPAKKAYVDQNGTAVPGYAGTTKQHVVNAPEPNGFSRRIKYDDLFRTIESTDMSNLSAKAEWDTHKDLILSTTDALGMKSTTVYDDDSQPVHQYGPAPAAWFGADRKPLTTPTDYTGQVAHAETAYDENIVGPAVAWHDYTRQAGNTSGVLSGAPKLHTTGLSSASPGVMSVDLVNNAPITASSGVQGIGFSATGKLRLPVGTYWVNADTSEGIRVWVDDQLVLDSWQDAAYRSITGGSFTVASGAVKRLRIDGYRKTGSTGAFNVWLKQDGGFNWTTDWSSYLKPGYSLGTSSKVYDSQLGNMAATINYGSNPELGLGQSSTIDPAGLNLTASGTYETPGAVGSFLRQTSKSLPGNPSTNPSFTYNYYGATDTRDNPCTTSTEAYKQAGFMQSKTEADPDGAGSQTGRKTETIYDEAGRIVASRYNTEGWTCTTYDARGRITQTVIPAYSSEAARTVQSDYAVGGNPLVTTSWDSNGWIVVWQDLLGRTTKYRDVHDDETVTTYDDLGRVTQRVSPVGTEVFEYDTYSRMINQKLDGVTYATVTYDQYSRVDHIDYPAANQMKATPGRDELGRGNSITYNLRSGSPGSNLVANPSLEQSTGTPVVPGQWLSSSWGTNTPAFTYPADGHTGTHSVKTEITSYTDGDAKWYFDPVNITGNTTYTFRNYYRSNVSTSVVLQYTHQDNSTSYVWLDDPAASSTWNQTNFTFTTPSTATKVTVFHVIDAVGWLQIDDAELFEPNPQVNLSDTVTRSQSGRVMSDVVQAGSNQLNSSYEYDGAGRLTSAAIGANTYSYGFGAQNASCGTANNMNPNAGKNSNRTSQTINGVTNYFCYDYADRLVGSSDLSANAAEYNSRGEMTFMGANDSPQRLCYDSSGRNWCLVSFDAAGDGVGMYYGRDVTGRITYREKDDISNWNWTVNSAAWYGYTGAGDTPDFIRNSNWDIIEKTVQLPGMVLTIRPQQTGNNQKQYSLRGMLGHTLLTTDATGTNTSNGNGPLSSFTYDPFGNTLPGSTNPANTVLGSYGFGGPNQRLTEISLALAPIQMGARVYFATLGRFTSVDQVEGGVENS